MTEGRRAITRGGGHAKSDNALKWAKKHKKKGTSEGEANTRRRMKGTVTAKQMSATEVTMEIETQQEEEEKYGRIQLAIVGGGNSYSQYLEVK